METFSPPLWQPNGTSWGIDRTDILALLREASIEDCQLIPRGSNYTFLATLSSTAAGDSYAVYKPCQGEAPLYDFPPRTLYKREYAAYLVSEAVGWRFVPPTIIRKGPHGVGSVQLFIESDEDIHYFVFRGRHVEEAKKIAVFDFVINNADRKAGHCLEGWDGRVWLIDNGLTFNAVPKLRTVIWDFEGEAIPPGLVDDLTSFGETLSGSGGITATLSTLLTAGEMEALQKRVDALIKNPFFPRPGYYRSVPWPPI